MERLNFSFQNGKASSGNNCQKQLTEVDQRNFCYFQRPRNVPTDLLEKNNNIWGQHMNTITNCNGSVKDESQNFYSEANINIPNNFKTAIMNSTGIYPHGIIETGSCYNDSTSIPRFSSTPAIPQGSGDDHLSDNFTKSFSQHPLTFNNCHSLLSDNCSISTDNALHRFDNGSINSVNSGNAYYPSAPSLPSVPPTYIMYDPRTNSYQPFVIFPQFMPMLASNIDVNNYCEVAYDNSNGYDFQNPCNIQLYDNQNSKDKNKIPSPNEVVITNGFVDNIADSLSTLSDSNINAQTETQSMPSFHNSTMSDVESSEDDQLNTVHGEDVLLELQKLSVFRNVINVPISKNNPCPEPVEFLVSSSSSRFKKTRIKERTMVWNSNQMTVKDNLVKIIPDGIKHLSIEKMNAFEKELFGDDLPIIDSANNTPLKQPQCVHSVLHSSSLGEVRPLMHSNQSSQWCRSATAPLSTNDPNLSTNQLFYSNISRYSNHRKSLQFPVPVTVFVNKFIPMVSPIPSHKNKFFVDQSANKIHYKKRRWSVSCSRLENSISAHSNRSKQQFDTSHFTNQLNDDFSFDVDLAESDEIVNGDSRKTDRTSSILNQLELKIDQQLISLKRTLMNQLEYFLSENAKEIKSMKSSQSLLENEIKTYRTRIQLLEDHIRSSWPEDEWKLSTNHVET